MSIVVGLDQHRAQVTAEWLDTESGEVSRARVMPGHKGRPQAYEYGGRYEA